MKRKFKFSLATNVVNSEVSKIQEFEFEDDATEDEIYDMVAESYNEWMNDVNYGGFKEVE